MRAADASCGDVQLLLPWAVTGRLDAEDAARVENHVAGCSHCRMELEQERRLAAHLSAEDNVEYAPSASLQRFMARLDREIADTPSALAESAAPASRPADRPVRRARRGQRWLLGLVAAQFAGIAVLGGLLVARAPVPGYVTLAEPEASARPPVLRVVFVPEMTLAELGALLGSVGAQVESGPSEAGVFTLSLAPGRPLRPALDALRADRRVRFAEPVTEREAPP